MSRIGARGPCPALLTRTSIRPQRAIVPSTRRFRSSFDWFDPVTPKPRSSFASASPLPDEDRIATAKPSEASRRAAAAPIPLPPAVTMATLSGMLLPSLREAATYRRRTAWQASGATLRAGSRSAPLAAVLAPVPDRPVQFAARDADVLEHRRIELKRRAPQAPQ